MLKKILKNIIGKKNILKFKILYWSITGNYLTSKPLATKEEYLMRHKEYMRKIKNNNFVNNYFQKEEINFVNNLALKTQVTQKKSEINYFHGFIIMKSLKDFLKNNQEKVTIFETGTAKGFSSIIMSFVLEKLRREYVIHTVDLIPHNRKILWNSISDIEYGRISRRDLLIDYSLYLKNTNFVCGTSVDTLNKLDINRIHFAFLDGSHDYEDVKFEFEFVNKKNKSGDIIILDDYTPKIFDGIVKLTNEIKEKNAYEVNIINNNEKRGYVILKKK